LRGARICFVSATMSATLRSNTRRIFRDKRGGLLDREPAGSCPNGVDALDNAASDILVRLYVAAFRDLVKLIAAIVCDPDGKVAGVDFLRAGPVENVAFGRHGANAAKLVNEPLNPGARLCVVIVHPGDLAFDAGENIA